jgi:NADH:ubiquinone oxidoreductase subunit 5 (subunit L)/multisubunit Na+/H+ antiporter MnhA subunit
MTRTQMRTHAGDHGHHGHDDHHEPHESPWVVTVPLVLLAIPIGRGGLHVHPAHAVW